jgi:hypothetical protein
MRTYQQLAASNRWHRLRLVRYGLPKLVLGIVLAVSTTLPLIGVYHVEPLTGSRRPVIHCADRYCAPPPGPAVERVISREEAAGRSCGHQPALTDHIVFEWSAGGVSVLRFVHAYRAGHQGRGWVRAYCTMQ